MPLTLQEQFKVSLLADMADRGLTVKEARAEVQLMTRMLKRIQSEKSADIKDIPLVGSVGHAINKVTDVGAAGAEKLMNSGIGYGLPLAAIGPFALGGLGGYYASKATDIDDDDVEAQKKRELIDLYRSQAQLMGRR